MSNDSKDPPLTYAQIVELWKTLPAAFPRCRLAFRPSDMIAKGKVYRLDLRTSAIAAISDVDVVYAVHPETLGHLKKVFAEQFPDFGERDLLELFECHHQMNASKPGPIGLGVLTKGN